MNHNTPLPDGLPPRSYYPQPDTKGWLRGCEIEEVASDTTVSTGSSLGRASAETAAYLPKGHIALKSSVVNPVAASTPEVPAGNNI